MQQSETNLFRMTFSVACVKVPSKSLIARLGMDVLKKAEHEMPTSSSSQDNETQEVKNRLLPPAQESKDYLQVT